jgi:hypothetical protein
MTLDQVARARAAVVFIEPGHAIVARTSPGGALVAPMRQRRESPEAFLGRIVHEIEDIDQLAVLGPGVERLALEREYVAITHRPDSIVRDEAAAAARPGDLLRRLAALAA